MEKMSYYSNRYDICLEDEAMIIQMLQLLTSSTSNADIIKSATSFFVNLCDGELIADKLIEFGLLDHFHKLLSSFLENKSSRKVAKLILFGLSNLAAS